MRRTILFGEMVGDAEEAVNRNYLRVVSSLDLLCDNICSGITKMRLVGQCKATYTVYYGKSNRWDCRAG